MEQVTAMEVYSYFSEVVTPSDLTAELGARGGDGILAVRSITTFSDHDTVTPPPPPPGTSCIDPFSDVDIRRTGVPVVGRNGQSTTIPRWCHQLKGGLESACAKEKYYVKGQNDVYRKCVPGREVNGVKLCTMSDPVEECGPSAPPPSPDAGTSGGAYFIDSSATQVNAGDDDCDDCVSSGGVAGIAVSTFVVGFTIGGLGLIVYFKSHSGPTTIK